MKRFLLEQLDGNKMETQTQAGEFVQIRKIVLLK